MHMILKSQLSLHPLAPEKKGSWQAEIPALPHTEPFLEAELRSHKEKSIYFPTAAQKWLNKGMKQNN